MVAVYTPDATGLMQPICTKCSGQPSDAAAVRMAQLVAERDQWKRACEKAEVLYSTAYSEVNRLQQQERALRAALAEALNRWEWFAQRFRDRIGGLAAADEHDYPRIAALRKLAEGT